MNSTDWPQQLQIFKGEFSLLEGELEDRDGFGRVWFNPIGSALLQQFLVKCGSQTIRLESSSQQVGDELRRLVSADKGWIARIETRGQDKIYLTLFSVGLIYSEKELDFSFDCSLEGIDGRVRNSQMRTIDTWSGRDLVLLRFDSESGRLFSYLNSDVAQISTSTDVPAVIEVKPREDLKTLGRWIVLDGAPENRDSLHWSDQSLLQLRSLHGTASEFMEAWRQYNEAEEREIEELRSRIGIVEYGNLTTVSEGSANSLVSITVAKGVESERGLAAIDDRMDSRGSLVVELMQSKPAPDDWEARQESRKFRFEVDSVIRSARRIHLKVPRDVTQLPKGGFLVASIAGDLVQIDRRKNAEMRFATGQCELKGLSEILRELPPSENRRRRREAGVSSSMRAEFRGELTDKQKLAIEIAINTPDIALIQGPPGTGKTQVIALIEKRLAELDAGGRHNRLILLTSTQNDAVDQVAAKTRIFGLPPSRDIGRGHSDPIEAWRKERLAAAREFLDKDEAHARITKAINLIQRIVGDHFTSDEQLSLLSELQSFTDSPRDKEALNVAKQSIAGNQIKKSRREKIERAIRSLRVNPEAFADDGFRRLIDVEFLLTQPGMPQQWGDEFLPEIEELKATNRNLWQECWGLQVRMLDFFIDSIDDRPRRFSSEIQTIARNIKAGIEKRAYKKIPGAAISIGEALDMYVTEISNSNDVDQVVREYTVVHAATCQRSALYFPQSKSESLRNQFENVIVDEAARVNPTDLLIPMVQAKERVILVGDHRQLPATFDEGITRGLAEVDLLDKSLFERLFSLLQDVGRNTGIPRTVTLDSQFRMHPRLGDFVSREFYEPYGESFRSGRPEEDFSHSIEGFEERTSVWIDIPLEEGSEERIPSGSILREVEAEKVARLASEIVLNNPELSVGVITFYSAQKMRILELLDDTLLVRGSDGEVRIADEFAMRIDSHGEARERLRVGSVDAFQGKEFDVVLLSLVRSRKIRDKDKAKDLFGFAAVENRLCVALSRQKRLLIVVGDKRMVRSEQAKALKGLPALLELCEDEDSQTLRSRA
jgi:hypothetical protein